MTVKEFIKVLKKENQNAIVFMDNESNTFLLEKIDSRGIFPKNNLENLKEYGGFEYISFYSGH